MTKLLRITPHVICLLLFCSATDAQIDFAGPVEALASRGGEDRQEETLDTAAGINSVMVSASIQDASSDISVTTSIGSASSSMTIVHQLDSGPVAVGGSASSGAIAFSLISDTDFVFSGLLEQQSTDPSGGGQVRIRNTDTFVTWYQANPNFALPNRPIDFSAILNHGTLPAGNYELTWFHAANHTSSTAQTLGSADFTLMLSVPGCNPADFNADNMLDFFDVSAFLIAFKAMDPSADLNNDGSFDFFDVSAFLTAFAEGCP